MTRHPATRDPTGPFDEAALRAAIARGAAPVPLYKQAITSHREWSYQRFRDGADIRELITERARFIDRLLVLAWKHFGLNEQPLCLVAVGGYGRGELHPHSDIDLLLLSDNQPIGALTGALERFIALLWDIKLNIGHSVRSIDETIARARDDITIATNLMESRVISGDAQLHQRLMQAVRAGQIWPSAAFFRAKYDEQLERHRKYANTEYNLEPNVKSSPGGLRDTQTIAWVAKRHYGVQSLEDLAARGFLLPEEVDVLRAGQAFLWRVRYALHMVSGRDEDRLLFDHQRTLATLFGYRDDDAKKAVERFMQAYYRWVLTLGELNEVLMQHFDEDILRACEPEQVLEINSRFRVRNGFIEVTNDKVFEKYPSALLEVFVLMAHNEHIDGVRASTIRLIRNSRELIDDEFRADPRNRALFIDLLRAPYKMSLQLRRMRRYGILGNYLPEFGNVIGQMQHDLFHIYTVDAHTMEVIKNMRRFHYDDSAGHFPIAARIVKRMDKPELLYIAGLYHDIGKGRGGDHSLLGAEDARAFCERHGLNKRDTNLVVWLVQHHLIMSSTAQRKDIADPEVIREFALQVGDQHYLDYLYVLTVADIKATNPTLWNSWRASLMRELYAETKRALRRGLENPVDKQEWIEETQQGALEILCGMGFDEDEIWALWAERGEDYFLREKVQDIVWHTEAIAQHGDLDRPLILIKPSTETLLSATQIFVYSRGGSHLFPMLASAMEQLDLSIQDARLYNASNGYALDTFFVLDANGEAIGDDPERIAHMERFLRQQLDKPGYFPDSLQRRTPRQARLFAVPTRTQISVDAARGYTVLEVVTPDRPGLLARIGKIFYEYGIELQKAKITTLGERVEDVFYITDNRQRPITSPELQDAIQEAIRRELDQQTTPQ
ncbi:MAG TPA: [protein-PII] uridylyltransferase [Spongiibacteraceae bacterium]|nr:[protein-PII] uridylyltransferase [Spongiibacteraceae bacterium]